MRTLCVTLSDRPSEVKALLCLFMAEHSLPFTLAPDLLALAKRLCSDVKTVQSLTFNRTAATYTSTHGVGYDVKESLRKNLVNRHFSLNIDEATNNAGNKFLNIMVQFYDEEAKQCIVQLLGVREVNISTSQNITEAVSSVLKERQLNCNQIVSVLMDNCNVMRGKWNGVETKLRAMNSNLLDVSGDTVHILNNAAKKFFNPIEGFLPLQVLCSDLFYDIEESPKVKEIFSLIQMKLYNKALALIRPISNRFNQMLTVSNRMCQLWDSLRIYYACFLEPVDARKFKAEIESLYTKYDLNSQDVVFIKDLLKKQKEQQKTDTNSARKERIIHCLFDKSDQTFVVLNLYRGVLCKFEHFIKLFQSSKPLVHLLHTELFSVMKEFFSFFIQPEHIPLYDAKKLSKIDYNNPELQLKKTSLYVGEYCKPLLLLYSRDKKMHQHWLDSFYSALRQSYIACATGMMKLPLLNETIIELSHLSPGCQKSNTTGAALLKLATKLPNVISPEELGLLDEEVKAYTVDLDISLIEADEEDDNFRLDMSWWSKIFGMKSKGQVKYNILSRLVKALLSIFCGPLVEASFNIMDDILRSDRSRMTTQNYEALAMIKSSMIGRQESTTSIQITPSMKSSVSSAYSRFCEWQASTSKNEAVTTSTTNTESSIRNNNSNNTNINDTLSSNSSNDNSISSNKSNSNSYNSSQATEINNMGTAENPSVKEVASKKRK